MSTFGYIVLYLVICLIQIIICSYLIYSDNGRLTIGDLCECVVGGMLVVIVPSILLGCWFDNIKDKVIL